MSNPATAPDPARRAPAKTAAGPGRGGVDGASLAISALCAVLLVGAIAPLTWVEIPAMLDYVNHLARMYLLAGPPNPVYLAHWRLYPNLAMDLVVPVMGRVIGVATAARIFFAASLILVVTGAVFIEWVVKGRHRLGGLGALLVIYSLPFAWGLANFTFGMGLAAWGVGLWIALRPRGGRLRFMAHAAVTAALFITHFFALGIYGLVIGLYELSRLTGRLRPLALLRLAAFMAAPVVVLLAVMFAAGGAIGTATFRWDFPLKALWALAFMNVYDLRTSILTGLVLVVVIAILVMERRFSLDRTGVWIAGALAALYVVLPDTLFGVDHVDVRLATVAAIVLPGFLRVALPPQPWRYLPLVLVVAIIAVNEATVALAWTRYQADLAQFRASFARLAPRSTVLVALQDAANVLSQEFEYQPIEHAPTLAAPFAGVFVSSLYADPGMQPLEPRPAFADVAVIHRHSAPLATASQLAAIAAGGSPANAPITARAWPRRYRYLYLIGHPGADPSPAHLVAIAAGRAFVLYRVIP